MKKVVIGWRTFDIACIKIAEWAKEKGFKNVYGIPRGGLVVAIKLSHLLDIPLTFRLSKNTLVVDDIVDSGKTLRKYKKYKTATIYKQVNCPISPSFHVYNNFNFIVFPYETYKTAKVNYLRVKK